MVPEMEEWKCLGLYYNCDENFSRFHTYRNLFLLEVDYAIDTMEPTEELDPQIYLLAITSVHTSETM